MTKAEYMVTKYWCKLRCTPIENKCKYYSILKYYKEYYDTGTKSKSLR